MIFDLQQKKTVPSGKSIIKIRSLNEYFMMKRSNLVDDESEHR